MELSETLEKVRDSFLDKSAELELLQQKATEQVRKVSGIARKRVLYIYIIFSYGSGKIPGSRPAAEHHKGWRDRFTEGRAGQGLPEVPTGVQTQARPSGQHQRGSDFSTEGRDWTHAQENSKDSTSLTVGRNRVWTAEEDFWPCPWQFLK